MRIGDPDQAIYNSDREKTEDWIPIDRALTIESSSRYFQEIANILTPLRTGCEHISSLRGNSGVKPVIIIYNDNCKHKVIESFISLLTKYGITDPNGIYKAIGWVKSETSKGLKIGDYWDEYQADTGGLTEMKYWSLIDAVCDDLKKGKAYHVESTIRKLLVKVLKYLNCKDDNHLSFTYSSIKKTLDKKYFDVYRGAILSLIELSTYSREAADLVIRNAINAMVKRNGQTIDVFPELPIYFIEDKPEAKTKSDSNNFIIDPIYGRKIHVSTIHKVKGETHDATLYLETVNNRKSDIERVIPYYKGTKSGDAAIDNYSRKCVYVGFSRPRKLLCVAMREETYVSAGKAFAGWEFFDCRSV